MKFPWPKIGRKADEAVPKKAINIRPGGASPDDCLPTVYDRALFEHHYRGALAQMAQQQQQQRAASQGLGPTSMQNQLDRLYGYAKPTSPTPPPPVLHLPEDHPASEVFQLIEKNPTYGKAFERIMRDIAKQLEEKDKRIEDLKREVGILERQLDIDDPFK